MLIQHPAGDAKRNIVMSPTCIFTVYNDHTCGVWLLDSVKLSESGIVIQWT